jgi:hypothetical protein
MILHNWQELLVPLTRRGPHRAVDMTRARGMADQNDMRKSDPACGPATAHAEVCCSQGSASC